MSEKDKLLMRGALSTKPELVRFFEFCDKWTKTKADIGKKTYRPSVTINRRTGETIKDPDGREYKHGFIKAAQKEFNVKSQQTITDRLNRFPNGIVQKNKHHSGVKPVIVEQWEQTPCYKRLIDKVSQVWDNKKQRLTNKGIKYNYPLYLAWKTLGKRDPLTFTEEDWLIIWGKDPKSEDSCHPSFKDSETHRLSYGYTIGLRWAMRNSVNPDVRELIQSKDARFDTNMLKREKGKHKSHYLSEEQCFLFPKAIIRIDTLMLAYYGILFGGRFEALNSLTPSKIDRTAHKISLYESKIRTTVEKSIYEPETSFMWRYIVEHVKDMNKPLFGRSITAYNRELKKTVEWFKQTAFPLHFAPTTHTAFKHTCVTQMSLHGVRMDTISSYIHTDPNTLMEFYRGGSEEKIDEEIGGIEKVRQAATWRAFVKKLTQAFEARYSELKAGRV